MAATRPQPRAEIAVAPASANDIAIGSVEDIVRLAEQHRDLQFKVLVRQMMRPVSFGQGRIELALAEGAPKTFYNDLSRRLESWTGRRWLIVPSDEDGAATLGEREAGARQAAESEAMSDPAVAAVLKRFPGARIVNITMRGNESLAAADTMAAPDEAGTDDVNEDD